MFLSDLGGIYGFTLGISIISILELFDFILLKVFDLIRFPQAFCFLLNSIILHFRHFMIMSHLIILSYKLFIKDTLTIKIISHIISLSRYLTKPLIILKLNPKMWKFWTERQRCRNKPPKKAVEVRNCQNIKILRSLELYNTIRKH